MKYLWVAVILGLSFNAFAAGKKSKRVASSTAGTSSNRVFENVAIKNAPQIEAEVVAVQPKAEDKK